ncbi:MerR family DNA-binding transcriptional regulator [Hazenella coriacea]|nr:MerR family DNA-binding transcriptional regulator [Hazenella coriacea]
MGKVAKEMNITIRTLRYYDEINLLKPSHTAESGYRYYSKTDIQRIMA